MALNFTNFAGVTFVPTKILTSNGPTGLNTGFNDLYYTANSALKAISRLEIENTSSNIFSESQQIIKEKLISCFKGLLKTKIQNTSNYAMLKFENKNNVAELNLYSNNDSKKNILVINNERINILTSDETSATPSIIIDPKATSISSTYFNGQATNLEILDYMNSTTEHNILFKNNSSNEIVKDSRVTYSRGRFTFPLGEIFINGQAILTPYYFKGVSAIANTVEFYQSDQDRYPLLFSEKTNLENKKVYFNDDILTDDFSVYAQNFNGIASYATSLKIANQINKQILYFNGYSNYNLYGTTLVNPNAGISMISNYPRVFANGFSGNCSYATTTKKIAVTNYAPTTSSQTKKYLNFISSATGQSKVWAKSNIYVMAGDGAIHATKFEGVVDKADCFSSEKTIAIRNHIWGTLKSKFINYDPNSIVVEGIIPELRTYVAALNDNYKDSYGRYLKVINTMVENFLAYVQFAGYNRPAIFVVTGNSNYSTEWHDDDGYWFRLIKVSIQAQHSGWGWGIQASSSSGRDWFNIDSDYYNSYHAQTFIEYPIH